MAMALDVFAYEQLIRKEAQTNVNRPDIDISDHVLEKSRRVNPFTSGPFFARGVAHAWQNNSIGMRTVVSPGTQDPLTSKRHAAHLFTTRRDPGQLNFTDNRRLTGQEVDECLPEGDPGRGPVNRHKARAAWGEGSGTPGRGTPNSVRSFGSRRTATPAQALPPAVPQSAWEPVGRVGRASPTQALPPAVPPLPVEVASDTSRGGSPALPSSAALMSAREVAASARPLLAFAERAADEQPERAVSARDVHRTLQGRILHTFRRGKAPSSLAGSGPGLLSRSLVPDMDVPPRPKSEQDSAERRVPKAAYTRRTKQYRAERPDLTLREPVEMPSWEVPTVRSLKHRAGQIEMQRSRRSRSKQFQM